MYRPLIAFRSPSLEARPPSVRRSLSVCLPSSGSTYSYYDVGFGLWCNDRMEGYHPRWVGEPLLPVSTPLFNTWLGKRIRSTAWEVACFARLRNINIGLPAVEGRRRMGEVARHQSCTWIHDVEGRGANHHRAAMWLLAVTV